MCATAYILPSARFTYWAFIDLSKISLSSGVFICVAKPVAVSANNAMAQACTPPMWFCTARRLRTLTRTCSRLMCSKRRPAVPKKGTKRPIRRVCTASRQEAGNLFKRPRLRYILFSIRMVSLFDFMVGAQMRVVRSDGIIKAFAP